MAKTIVPKIERKIEGPIYPIFQRWWIGWNEEPVGRPMTFISLMEVWTQVPFMPQIGGVVTYTEYCGRLGKVLTQCDSQSYVAGPDVERTTDPEQIDRFKEVLRANLATPFKRARWSKVVSKWETLHWSDKKPMAKVIKHYTVGDHISPDAKGFVYYEFSKSLDLPVPAPFQDAGFHRVLAEYEEKGD